MSKETLKANLREIPDFPIPGILFYDVTTLFKNAECLQEMLDTLYEMYKDKGITKVVGIESRGFIMGGALAARLGAGFVMARKPGKLPAEVVEETYAKEYGTDTIQIHKDAINENDVVLLHDDLLATGGTMAATHRLVQRCGAKKIFINFIIELGGLNGRKAFPEDITVDTLLTLWCHTTCPSKRAPSSFTIKRDLWNEMDDETERYISSGCKIYNVTA